MSQVHLSCTGSASKNFVYVCVVFACIVVVCSTNPVMVCVLFLYLSIETSMH